MSEVKTPSTLRAEQAAMTRARIVEAASALFVAEGFVKTRIEDVAERARVSVPTVYKVFTNKATLLIAALDAAMTGTDDASTVHEQAWWLEQLDEPDPGRQLDLIARNARQIYERAGLLLGVVRSAAVMDHDVAEVWERVADDRSARGRTSARRFVAKAGKRARLSADDTALTLWALTDPDLYTAVVGGGRTPKKYEGWLAGVLRASLLDG